jgi:hypothetical protein
MTEITGYAGSRHDLVDEMDFLERGEYGKDLEDGTWWICPPRTGFPLSRLTNHQVDEHEDGTITVSPSILSHGHDDKTWHGYLERGVWREV